MVKINPKSRILVEVALVFLRRGDRDPECLLSFDFFVGELVTGVQERGHTDRRDDGQCDADVDDGLDKVPVMQQCHNMQFSDVAISDVFSEI